MNSRNSNAPAISADQVAASLVTASKNGTVGMLGMAPVLRDLAQLLIDQTARIAELERAQRTLEGGR